jgi:hypothetical protein
MRCLGDTDIVQSLIIKLAEVIIPLEQLYCYSAGKEKNPTFKATQTLITVIGKLHHRTVT